MSNVMDEVKKLITKNGELEISNDENLFENGYLDSMGVFEVISLIEDITGKDFNPDNFTAENFATFNAIDDLIIREFND